MLVNRGIIASATSLAASAIESAFPTDFPKSLQNITDVLNGTIDLPSGSSIESFFGINSTSGESDLSALIIPGYANLTTQGWNIRIQGLAYKSPILNDSQIDSATSKFLPGLNGTFNDTERTLLRNRTSELINIPQSNVNLSVSVRLNGSDLGTIPLPPTDLGGEFDSFEQVSFNQNLTQTAMVELFTQNVEGPGNGSAFLVPTTGYSVVSDIDDVLRVTKIYKPLTGLRNSFAEPYVNFMNMPELLYHWQQTLPGAAFHYDTTTPVQLTRTYIDYLFSNYPPGSLDMRPLNLSDPSVIFSARQDSLTRLFQSFPSRKFILIGDTSSSTLLKAYPQIAKQYPAQIACIFIRNTTATDGEDKLPFDTSPFQGLNKSTYFFYTIPDDILGLNIVEGQCVNGSIVQNVTFSEQGGPATNGSTFGGNNSSNGSSSGTARVRGDIVSYWGWGLVCSVVAMMVGM